jgi:hypothetical protein
VAPHMYHYGDADGNEHCFECDGTPTDCRICYPENKPTNARLIAAAPDLLAALIEIADRAAALNAHEPMAELEAIACAAIAAAEGGTA